MNKQFGTSASKVACVDFDGTLVEWGDLMSPKQPEDGAREVLTRLRDAGYRIVIFTSRASFSWAMRMTDNDPDAALRFHDTQLQYVVEHLTQHHIPFDDITAEKIPAEFYIDDLAHRYEGNWHAIGEKLFAQAD